MQRRHSFQVVNQKLRVMTQENSLIVEEKIRRECQGRVLLIKIGMFFFISRRDDTFLRF